jgi:dTDP-4-dehydrorhamnose 3,5-epimerase-like enzyme
MALLPDLINGGTHTDERGELTFFNDLDLTQVKRMYKIEHPNTETVRAWQAHKKEQKWFHVIRGSFKMVIVQPDEWENPSADLPVTEFVLTSENNQVLHVYGGSATGFQALQPGSQMIVFSDFTVQQSGEDNFRFPGTLWYQWK